MRPTLRSICRTMMWAILTSGGALQVHAQITFCCSDACVGTFEGTTSTCALLNLGAGVPYTVWDSGSYIYPISNPNGTIGVGEGQVSGNQVSATGACVSYYAVAPTTWVGDDGSSGGSSGVWCDGAYYSDTGLWGIVPVPIDTNLFDAWCEYPYCMTGCSQLDGSACGTCGSYNCDGDCIDPCWNDDPPGSGDGGGGGGNQCDGDGSGCDCDGQNDWCSTDGDCSSREDLICDPGSCTCQPGDYDDPILIDISGAGLLLTNIQNGVRFDILADGRPPQLAWSAAGSEVGFLALDRNGNGKIDSGAELFTGISPQGTVTRPSNGSAGTTPVRLQSDMKAAAVSRGTGQRKLAATPRKTGIAALAFFDQPANGGNGDGKIDPQDAVYSRLLVWVDKNHDGISQPDELFTLAELGITSISLNPERAGWTDAYGNKVSSKVTVVRNGVAQWAYDVFLTATK